MSYQNFNKKKLTLILMKNKICGKYIIIILLWSFMMLIWEKTTGASGKQRDIPFFHSTNQKSVASLLIVFQIKRTKNCFSQKLKTTRPLPLPLLMEQLLRAIVDSSTYVQLKLIIILINQHCFSLNHVQIHDPN